MKHKERGLGSEREVFDHDRAGEFKGTRLFVDETEIESGFAANVGTGREL